MPPKYLPHKHLVCVIPCIISIIESRVLTRITTLENWLFVKRSQYIRIENLLHKQSACVSKQDVLELATLRYSNSQMNRKLFCSPTKNVMLYEIRMLLENFFKPIVIVQCTRDGCNPPLINLSWILLDAQCHINFNSPKAHWFTSG